MVRNIISYVFNIPSLNLIIDIGVTSAACKSLHENSLVLRNKHEAFLRKIPFSPAHSPSVSVSQSPANPSTPLPLSPYFYGANVPHWSANSSTSALSPPTRRRHTRKISVSQNDIALLSDQNAELMSKLETLETECAQTEQTARRKLRQLEQEIQGLREELEVTQMKNEELEEKARSGVSKAEELWRKKLEREEKVRALRGGHDTNSGSDEVKDFAPGSNVISGGRSADSSPTKRVQTAGSDSCSFRPVFEFPPKTPHAADHSDNDDIFSSLHLTEAQSRAFMSPSKRELAVVAQLLSKIQELQEANEQISEQQAKTASTLHSVHKNAESIRRVYECLGNSEGVEWQIVADEAREMAEGEKRPGGDETIRFQSFRRSLELDIPPSEDHFSNGIGGSMQSTVNEAALNRIVSNHKTRKSVVGLFDAIGTSNPSSPSMFGPRVPFPIDTDYTCVGDSSVLHSPALSTVSIGVPLSTNDKRPTLGSELGGEDWVGNSGHHHLRNTSLYQLTIPSTPPSPGRTLHATQESTSPRNKTPGPVNHQGSSSHGRNSLQALPDHVRTADSGQGHQRDRYRRMSQTIRARTSQWLDGRFKETLPSPKRFTGRSPEDEIGTGLRSPLAPAPQRLALATMFDSVACTFAEPEEQELTRSEPDDGGDSQMTLVKVHSDSTSAKKPQGISAVILELWLWLQFSIIILVFLWAMAKRGPKSVLGEVEKRKVASAKHS